MWQPVCETAVTDHIHDISKTIDWRVVLFTRHRSSYWLGLLVGDWVHYLPAASYQVFYIYPEQIH